MDFRSSSSFRLLTIKPLCKPKQPKKITRTIKQNILNFMHLRSKRHSSFFYNTRQRWEDFGNVYWLFGREAELQRLVTWASNKRLSKPRQAYQNRLTETQTSLTRIQWRSPGIWQIANFCFQIFNWAFPPPRYMRKGSAAIYRRDWLTTR